MKLHWANLKPGVPQPTMPGKKRNTTPLSRGNEPEEKA
jgi:hypothetical protein